MLDQVLLSESKFINLPLTSSKFQDGLTSSLTLKAFLSLQIFHSFQVLSSLLNGSSHTYLSAQDQATRIFYLKSNPIPPEPSSVPRHPSFTTNSTAGLCVVGEAPGISNSTQLPLRLLIHSWRSASSNPPLYAPPTKGKSQFSRTQQELYQRCK